MMFGQRPKTIGITKEQEWEAWKRIKQGGHGAGVDQVTIEMIEANPREYLYPVWNRLARWVACKFKITSKWNGFAWLIRISKMQPTLFEHWKYGWLPSVCYEEPYDGRLSSTVLREAGAEMPRPTRQITDSGTLEGHTRGGGNRYPSPDSL